MLIPAIHERKSWLLFLLLLAIGANFYFNFSTELSLKERALSIDRAFGRLLFPIQWVVSTSKMKASDSLEHIQNLVAALEENQKLKTDLESQRMKLSQYEELRFENLRLQELLGFRAEIPDRIIAARVVGVDPSTFFSTLLLDRGSEDGVRENMPVISVRGVVGRIFQVQPNRARVLLISDISSRVDVVVQRSRARAIVAGSLESELFLRFLPRRQNLEVGDQLVTSGMDGIFPPGQQVGRIRSLEKNPNLVLESASIEPAVDFRSIEEVLIVDRAQASEMP